MNQLTEREKEVLEYLEHYNEKNGWMPSTREIQQHFGWKSQTRAMQHLRSLTNKGYIERNARVARCIKILEH